MEVTNPTMVVIVEQLWATKTGDANDPNPMMLVDNQENCAILHPDVTEVPEANPYDANREFLKFPYIAYELDPAMFDSKSLYGRRLGNNCVDFSVFNFNIAFLALDTTVLSSTFYVTNYFRGWIHSNFHSFCNKSLRFITRKLLQTSMPKWSNALAAHS